MKKLITVLLTALSIMALSTANVRAAMPFTEVCAGTTKLIESKPVYRNAALSTITLETYDICVPIILTLLAGELNGQIYKRDTVYTYGILWGALRTWEHAQIANGIPEDVLGKTVQPYNNESNLNERAYLSKYSLYCSQAAIKFSKAAGIVGR